MKTVEQNMCNNLITKNRIEIFDELLIITDYDGNKIVRIKWKHSMIIVFIYTVNSSQHVLLSFDLKNLSFLLKEFWQLPPIYDLNRPQYAQMLWPIKIIQLCSLKKFEWGCKRISVDDHVSKWINFLTCSSAEIGWNPLKPSIRNNTLQCPVTIMTANLLMLAARFSYVVHPMFF